MIKAVFFDFFNTLVGYDPSREMIYEKVCRNLGMPVKARDIYQTLVHADLFMRDEELIAPIEKRPPLQQRDFFTKYMNMALSGCKVEVDPDSALKIYAELKKLSWEFKAFKDTIPALQELKSRGLILGLISNVAKDMSDIYQELRLSEYLDCFTSSLDTGYDKPQKEIFLAAMEKCSARPEESIFVGDQYEIDIVGARNSNMQPILIDRNDWFGNITDCPRIRSLTELARFLD